MAANSASYCTIRVCVDAFSEEEFRGRFFPLDRIERGRTFDSLMHLLVDVENLLDHAPASAGGCGVPPELDMPAGKQGTFLVRILYRQHASWQGSLSWIEGRAERHFRSVLELILLMENALSCGRGGQGRTGKANHPTGASEKPRKRAKFP